MKSFIDGTVTRYYGGEALAPKVVGIIAVAAESLTPVDTLDALRRFVALSSPEEVPVLALGGCADKPGDATFTPGSWPHRGSSGAPWPSGFPCPVLMRGDAEPGRRASKGRAGCLE